MLSVVGPGLRRTSSPLRPLPHSPLVRIVGLILIKRSHCPKALTVVGFVSEQLFGALLQSASTPAGRSYCLNRTDGEPELVANFLDLHEIYATWPMCCFSLLYK